MLRVGVRHVDDPYLVATRLTGGSLDFGESAASLRTTGIAVTVVGVLLLLCCGGLCYGMHTDCHACDDKSRQPIVIDSDAYVLGRMGAGALEGDDGEAAGVEIVSPIAVAAGGAAAAAGGGFPAGPQLAQPSALPPYAHHHVLPPYQQHQQQYFAQQHQPLQAVAASAPLDGDGGGFYTDALPPRYPHGHADAVFAAADGGPHYVGGDDDAVPVATVVAQEVPATGAATNVIFR